MRDRHSRMQHNIVQSHLGSRSVERSFMEGRSASYICRLSSRIRSRSSSIDWSLQYCMASPSVLPTTRMIMTIFHNRPNCRQDNEITAEHASTGLSGHRRPLSSLPRCHYTIPLFQSVFLILPAVNSSQDVVLKRNWGEDAWNLSCRGHKFQ